MIAENVKQLLDELPPGVELVAAAKARRPEEVLEAVKAGVKIIGENYVQEAERACSLVGRRVKWHFIGRLQTNKVKKTVALFDMIETVDRLKLAEEIDRRCAQISRVMPVLVEVNSGREVQKAGVMPENVEKLIRDISRLQHIKVMGLMAMGPYAEDPEYLRPCFALTRNIFEKIKKLNLPKTEIKYLSMGMTDSYRIAIEEGANIVRIGTKIFGARSCRKGLPDE